MFKTYQVYVIETRYFTYWFLIIGVFLITFISIVANYLVIKTKGLILVLRIALVSTTVITLGSEFMVFYVLAKLSSLQEVSIRRQRLTLCTKYYRKYLKSFKIQTYSIGSFCPVHRMLPFRMVHLVVDFTITLLITVR